MSMHIIQAGKFYPPYRGGMEQFLQLLARGLAARGVSTDVIVAGRSTKTCLSDDQGVHVTEVGCFGKLLSQPLSPAYPLHVRKALPGIVHLHAPNPLADLTACLTPRSTPLVMTYHSDVVKQKLAGALLRPLLRHILKRCRRIVTTWPGMEEASPVLRAFSDKCVAIPLGIDPTPFLADIHPREHLPAALQQEQRPYFLFIGRMAWYKGLTVLVQALAKLPDDVCIALIGTGPYRAEAEALAESLGVAHRCLWLGDCSEDEKVAALQHSLGLVLPSTHPAEMFGIVQLEAMATGKPIINTSLPSGVPFVARHEQEALTLTPGDVDAFADACRTLWENASLREQLGTAGRARLHAEFTADVMVERYLRLYKELS